MVYLDIMHRRIKRMVKIGGMFLMTKKNFVFAASFLTMLVVNAAWADIASTKYVTTGLSNKQDIKTAVTRTANTAAGTTTRPVYVTSGGVATEVSGISVPVKEEGNTKSWAEIWVE